ncbi:CBS domain-containing protein [Actinomadura sp. KC06]|nr:CBS domain-containing protein [Actinomadura sp. KC06]
MRARELAVEFPTVTPDSSAAEAARLLAENGLPGLIVVDERHHPKAVLPGTQLLRSVIPHYVRDAPTLARVYDEGHADRLCAHLAGKSVADLLGHERTPVLERMAVALGHVAALPVRCVR